MTRDIPTRNTNETGYPIIVCIVFVPELYTNTWTRTRERDGTRTLLDGDPSSIGKSDPGNYSLYLNWTRPTWTSIKSRWMNRFGLELVDWRSTTRLRAHYLRVTIHGDSKVPTNNEPLSTGYVYRYSPWNKTRTDLKPSYPSNPTRRRYGLIFGQMGLGQNSIDSSRLI